MSAKENAPIRLEAKCERFEQQVAKLTEEIRVKDARMARLDPRNRPHYPARSEWPFCCSERRTAGR